MSKSSKEIYEEALSRVPISTKLFVRRTFDIADALDSYIDENELSMEQVSDKLDKPKSYVESILWAQANLDLETICKLEEMIGKGLLITYRERLEEDE